MSSGYDQLLAGLRKSFASGKTKPIEWRVKQLKGLLRMYEENEAIFTEALHKDLRKPRWEAVGAEIEFNKNEIIGCLRDIKHWTKEVETRRNLATILDRTLIKPEPYGVVLIIGSWNYPLHISLGPLSGAIAAGNCAVIKPSEISPNTASAIENLLPRYVDKDCFQ